MAAVLGLPVSCLTTLTGADDAVVTGGGLQPQLVLDGPAGGGHRLGEAACDLSRHKQPHSQDRRSGKA